jgi:hypothetical protein
MDIIEFSQLMTGKLIDSSASGKRSFPQGAINLHLQAATGSLAIQVEAKGRLQAREVERGGPEVERQPAHLLNGPLDGLGGFVRVGRLAGPASGRGLGWAVGA